MTAIHPLLDKEKQRLARRYEKEKRWLGLAGMALYLVILLAFYVSGLSFKLAHLEIGGTFIFPFLLYVLALQATLALLSFPLNFYRSYIHEHKWNFSNHTVKSWLWEQVKAFWVGFVLFSLLLGLLLWIMDFSPQYWWLIAGLGMAVVSVLLATIFPVVVLPIFNKYIPIENKELTDSLEEILSREGLKSSGFFKEDMSRQTKKENAFLAGLGKTRRVVLGDNLLKNMHIPEIQSIIAHEVGHYRHRHIWKNVAVGTAQQLIVFFLVSVIMKTGFQAFLSSSRENLALLPVFLLLMGGISGFLFTPINQAISRHFERKADLYALSTIANPKDFMTAMSGLADRNLSNAYPQPWIKILYYSHPPVGERLEMAENFLQSNQNTKRPLPH
jgi:STE24 endopeptidase